MEESKNIAPNQEDYTSYDPYIIKFVVVSIISLLIGTLMGVAQVFPPVIQWLVESGRAGHWIDPLAHAHINLVGGVTTGMMGVMYYIVPRLMKRPIYSVRLSNSSFWFSLVGVFGFFGFMVARGLYVGTLMHQGMPFQEANMPWDPDTHRMLIPGWLTVGVIISSISMGFGYWGFILSIWLTIYNNKK